MAITTIGKITNSPNGIIDYVQKDKISKTQKDIDNSIAFKEIDGTDNAIYYTLSSFQNCSKGTAKDSFNKYAEEGRDKHRRNSLTKDGKEIVAYHLVQSFDTYDKLSPAISNEIGQKLAREVFGKHACVISTHTNSDNIHNHIAISAWDTDGRKWLDNDKTKRLIRTVSDRLCEEYGLNVLHKTKDMKMVSYTDREGKKRRFEPTERKIELVKRREAGEVILGDINDFRNSPAYKEMFKSEASYKDIIKKDIDNLLPTVRSYEELLERLKESGYTINDKKRNGEWLKHISFIAPLQVKGIRDYKLGDGEFYKRKNLTDYIESIINRSDNEKEEKPKIKIPYYESYDYSNINMADINDVYRVSKAKEGNLVIVKRSEVERIVLKDIKKCDIEIKGLIDTTGIYKIIEEQEAANKERKAYTSTKKEEILVAQIKDSFENLMFIERKGLYSYEQINSLYKSTCESYKRGLAQLKELESIISKLDIVLEYPQKAAELYMKIENNKSNDEYMFEDYHADLKKLEFYRERIIQSKIDTLDGEQLLINKTEEARSKLVMAKKSVEALAVGIYEYERCIRVLDRIERESNSKNVEVSGMFDETRKTRGEVAGSLDRKGRGREDR